MFNHKKNLSIAFDTWILSSKYRFQGYWVYAHRLLREFQQLVAKDDSVEMQPFVSTDCENDANSFEYSKGFKPQKSRFLKHQRFWRCGGVSLSSFASRADLLFSPTVYAMPLGLIPIVVTVGDATPIKLPSDLLVRNSVMKAFTALAAKRARRVLTFSDHSKQDLIDLFHLSPDKIDVTYLSHDHQLFNADPPDARKKKGLLSRLGITKPCIFHHGTVQPRKNLERLIHAYGLLLERRPDFDFDLVLSGIFGWQHEPIVEAGRKLKGRGKVIFTGAVPEEDLAILVKSAALCVIPSLYEGFCLPMVEAMACGTVTITANNSCLPEVSGNALLYFDASSVEQMAGTMETALGDSELRSQLSTRGRMRAEQFSWSRCADETLNILKQVGNGNCA